MNSNFLTAIHILSYLAFPGNGGAPAAHIVSFVRYASHGGVLVTSDEIAGVLNTNPVVIRRLLAQLRRAGLVISIRGKAGGYQLQRPATEISLLDAFLAVAGDQVDFFALAHRNNRPGCSPIANSLQESLQPVFAQSLARLQQDLSGHSIAQVLSEAFVRLENVPAS